MGVPVRGGAGRGGQPQGDRIPDDLALARAIARRGAGATGRRGTPPAATAIRSGRTTACAWAASRSPGRRGCWGHSDGDAALHAICDAPAGRRADRATWAALFPAGDPATRGIDSRELLRAVVARLAGAGSGAGVASTSPSRVLGRGWVVPGWTGCGRVIAELAGPDAGCRLGQGRDGQPGGRRGGRPDDLRDRPRGGGDAMSLSFRNTLGGALEPFQPSSPGERRHVQLRADGLRARARRATSAASSSRDLVRRYLGWKGYAVTWVMNITDVDDKIIRDAAREGITIGELTVALHAGVPRRPGPAARRPAGRAAAGHRAHRRHGGAHRDAPGAGSRLPHRRRLDLLPDRVVAGLRHARAPGAGRRSGSASASRRTSTARTTCATSRSGRAPSPASRSWSTAIGEGRPGWHIECSAMSMRYLGPIVRHPHRRRRPGVPASRGRDRPVGGRHRRAVRAHLAALRPPPDGRREDGQAHRQHRAAGRRLRQLARARARCGTRCWRPTTGAASTSAEASLAAATAAVERLSTVCRRPRAPTARSGRTIATLAELLRRPGRRSPPHWTTTSTCRRRSPPSSTWSRELNRRMAERVLSTADAAAGLAPAARPGPGAGRGRGR